MRQLLIAPNATSPKFLDSVSRSAARAVKTATSVTAARSLVNPAKAKFAPDVEYGISQQQCFRSRLLLLAIRAVIGPVVVITRHKAAFVKEHANDLTVFQMF